MPYRMIEHTADLCFEVTSASFGGLLAESLRAITAWTRPLLTGSGGERRFSIRAADRETLLVDLLNEALALSQIHREAYDGIEFDALDETCATGRFLGRSIAGAHDEIKAVTYHGARVERLPDGSWSATVLMDISYGAPTGLHRSACRQGAL